MIFEKGITPPQGGEGDRGINLQLHDKMQCMYTMRDSCGLAVHSEPEVMNAVIECQGMQNTER